MIKKIIHASLLMTILLFMSSAFSWWKPTQTMTWDVQYVGDINPNLNVEIRDIDLYDVGPEKIRQMKANGQKIICYLSAGSSESWRVDYKKFPAAVKGKALDGWAGEKWLDVRRLDILMPIMEARMDIAVHKGCDAIDPDNMDAYSNKSGFPITKAHSIAYFKALANAAHERGLAIGLKNAMEMIPVVLPLMDFAVNEQCREYDECDTYKPVVAAGKPVFGIEYRGDPTKFCPEQNAMLHTTLKKYLSLNAYRVDCDKYRLK